MCVRACVSACVKEMYEIELMCFMWCVSVCAVA